MRSCNMATSVLYLAVVAPLVAGDIVTSIDRIKNMVRNENLILGKLKSALPDDTNFQQFYTHRLKEIRTRNLTDVLHTLEHPNGLYRIIQAYAHDYKGVRGAVSAQMAQSVQGIIKAQLATIADENDAVGARLSLVRLQGVYNLKPSDMVQGNYLGFRGPAITGADAFYIGQAAFTDGRPKQSVSWFEAAIALARPSRKGPPDVHNMAAHSGDSGDLELDGGISVVTVKALMARALLRMGKDKRAKAIYAETKSKEPNNGEVLWLEYDLHDPNLVKFQDRPWSPDEKKFIRLCAEQNKITTDLKDSSLRCRYKIVYLPYVRYAEEILSWSPYVSIFYNVTTDSETERIKEEARSRLYRGFVVEYGGQRQNDFRTSHLTFIEDKDSSLVARVSKRVSILTGLETAIAPSGYYSKGQSSSEPIQIVNYGLGGHYSVHLDPIKMVNADTKHMLTQSGDRLATFLIYLSKVERGGSTVFPELDIAVSPLKNSAVFWYSFTPSGEVDERTMHASCPVVVGEKWISNKWILNYGNTFARRCGLDIDDTQKDVEADMRRGYIGRSKRKGRNMSNKQTRKGQKKTRKTTKKSGAAVKKPAGKKRSWKN